MRERPEETWVSLLYFQQYQYNPQERCKMKKLTKPEKWYQRRLAKYFNDHYHGIEDEAEFYTDRDCNQWDF